MEKFIEALTELVKRGLVPGAPRAKHGDEGNGPATPLEVSVDMSTAPACVQRLAEAMSTGYYHVQIGKMSMYEAGAAFDVGSLESTIQQACERGEIDPAWVAQHGGANDSPFNPAMTLQLGADGGGMSYFGVSWSEGKLGLVVVEFEDPVQDNLLAHFGTPDEFFAFLAELDDGDEQSEDLVALKAAVAG